MEEFLDANLAGDEEEERLCREGKEKTCRSSSPFYLCGGWYHDEGVQKYGGGIPGEDSRERAENEG
eukprot:111719-Hanusia_phi.AAC.1